MTPQVTTRGTWRRRWSTAVHFAGLACEAAVAGGPTYSVEWSTMESGGYAHSSGGGYTMSSAVGQPDAGGLAGGGYTVRGGFWVDTCEVATPAEAELIDRNPGAGTELAPSLKNRFLSFQAGDASRQQAILVTMVSLPGPWAAWNGTELWVGSPQTACENSGVGLGGACPAGAATFLASKLTCTGPYYTDWSGLRIVHAYHPGIVPGGTYEVRVIERPCGISDASLYSAPLVLNGPRWGDVAGPFDAGAGLWTAPNGTVDVAVDVVADLDKFGNRPGAPIKARADVEPCIQDFKINISDVTRLLDAFRNLPYPFAPGVGSCPADPCAVVE